MSRVIKANMCMDRVIKVHTCAECPFMLVKGASRWCGKVQGLPVQLETISKDCPLDKEYSLSKELKDIDRA